MHASRRFDERGLPMRNDVRASMEVELACTLKARMKGLLGRAEADGALLLAPCHDIHTFGMVRPIDVAFIASDGTVVASYRDVGPGRRLLSKSAVATIERFACANTRWFELGDSVQLGAAPANNLGNANGR